jgi:hypothetical protein
MTIIIAVIVVVVVLKILGAVLTLAVLLLLPVDEFKKLYPNHKGN